ncbi:fimbrial assembly chaperone [Salmonella enterica subsp. enterica serovar Daytona]|uniref:Fimbrial assembly chaperone n=1 Tax=Salmonella enterica subsp. enterica serovar Daytona TaxID=1962639 RepID=A0A447JN98_SALET|nr:fimbrial assembly chaperone [Salmonella enterica subsp. enterica serovar Daytona]
MQPQHSICNITDPGGQRRLAPLFIEVINEFIGLKQGCFVACLCGSLAHAAGINIGTTRVIFHGDAKDASISISQ